MRIAIPNRMEIRIAPSPAFMHKGGVDRGLICKSECLKIGETVQEFFKRKFKERQERNKDDFGGKWVFYFYDAQSVATLGEEKAGMIVRYVSIYEKE